MIDSRRSKLASVTVLFSCVLIACGGGGSGSVSANSSETVQASIPDAGASSSASTSDGQMQMQAGTQMPYVNKNRIPTGSAGNSSERVRAINDQPSSGDGTGAFRAFCDFSHMAFDDPIVFPGQPGLSHLHTFFGNTGTNGNSTAESIASSGNSTCRGGTINRTAYWVPTMIDTQDGTPIAPASSNFYYKTGLYPESIPPSSVQSMPKGLRMIAGDMKNAAPSGNFSYACVGPDVPPMEGKSIPNCPVGSDVWQNIDFPQCWDGKNLDSPDHKSHMAYPTSRGCPASHPVPLLEMSFHIVYPVKEANAPLRWRLSSDNYSSSLPGGYSAHGDWFNGWVPERMEKFVRECDQAARDCHSHLLGNGLEIY